MNIREQRIRNEHDMLLRANKRIDELEEIIKLLGVKIWPEISLEAERRKLEELRRRRKHDDSK